MFFRNYSIYLRSLLLSFLIIGIVGFRPPRTVFLKVDAVALVVVK